MTKSTGVGRGVGGGGPQPGAGRPRTSSFAPFPEPAPDQAAKPRRRRIRSAKSLVGKAYETLEFVMAHSPSPAARVKAARAVIELAKAEALEAEAYPPPRKFRASDGEWDGLLEGET